MINYEHLILKVVHDKQLLFLEKCKPLVMGKSRILQLMNNIALISLSTSQVFLFICLLDFSLNL